MTTQPSGRPPSSERPTGPPSGPLSGGQQGPPPPPPPAPPSGPAGPGGSGGPGGSDGPGEPAPEKSQGPWWRSVPRLATALVAVAAVAALVVVLTRPSGTSTSAGGEVFLQPVASSGPDPFTESTAVKDAAPPPDSPPPQSPTTSPGGTARPTPSATASPGTQTGTRSVSGSAPGVYAGTRNVASCDTEKLIHELSVQPAKNAAFASTLGIQAAAVPGYLRSLTPVALRMDTRVTNHGYRNGQVYSYQAVLEAGTAVLVDDRGCRGCAVPAGTRSVRRCRSRPRRSASGRSGPRTSRPRWWPSRRR